MLQSNSNFCETYSESHMMGVNVVMHMSTYYLYDVGKNQHLSMCVAVEAHTVKAMPY